MLTLADGLDASTMASGEAEGELIPPVAGAVLACCGEALDDPPQAATTATIRAVRSNRITC
ncbi:MAG TPA: hypothetical protein VE219_03360, partial [Candidatus Sulfotelmatobacter sp.]|nr:hypothetical protein [Candidatus Sulfotelmatobacter sp.]